VLGEYLAPFPKMLSATIAIALLTTVNIMGINRTALVAKILATVTVIYFSVAAVIGTLKGAVMQGLSAGFCTGVPNCQNPPALSTLQGNWAGLLPAAAVLFFAFAGYARVATLGNEVVDAKRNIPKAIRRSLILVLVIYLGVSLALASNFGAKLATLPQPFVSLYQSIAPGFPPVFTQLVAVAACLGSILALLAGVSRTAATMAEDRELPAAFEKRNRFGSPWLAEVIIAVGSILVLQLGSLAWVIGFSSLSVLLYYAIGHYSAIRQPREERKVSRVFNWMGLALCSALLVAVPGPALWVSAVVLIAALGVRAVARRRVTG
jgi:APA family basic amino acid/polyamine antiporter